MSTGPQIGYGLRRLIDSRQRYYRAAFPVYLRLKNFPDTQALDWSQLGFSISPSGSPTGTTDILISPPASYIMVSVHNIGMSNGKLRFGARVFHISHTFVRAQMAAQGISDQTLIWRAPNVVGLVTENLLCSIEDIAHEEAGAETVSWILTCNCSEIR